MMQNGGPASPHERDPRVLPAPVVDADLAALAALAGAGLVMAAADLDFSRSVTLGSWVEPGSLPLPRQSERVDGSAAHARTGRAAGVSTGTRGATALQRKRRRWRPTAASRKGHSRPLSAARLLESMLPTLCAERGSLPVAYKRRRTRWIRDARGEAKSTRPHAPPSQVDRRAEPRLALAASRAASTRATRPLRGHALRGSRCRAASALRPASHPPASRKSFSRAIPLRTSAWASSTAPAAASAAGMVLRRVQKKRTSRRFAARRRARK
jgi:hypothetical protein